MTTLLNFFWFLYVFLNSIFPVGGFSLLKSIAFMLVILFSFMFLIFNNSTFKVRTLFFLLTPYLIIVFFFFKTLALMEADGGALYQFISMSSMFLAVQLGWLLHKEGALYSTSIIRALVFGLFFYGTLKFVVTLLIFFSVIPLTYITYFSPDMTSLGNIGLPGFHRFASVNDFLLPFVFFFIPKAKLSPLFTRFIQFAFLFTILFSFTRSIWVIFFVLLFVNNVRSFKFVVFSFFSLGFVVASLFVIEEYTEFAIITSVENRIFVEGEGSTSEKVVQFGIITDELNDYVLSGKGLGTYVESYVRNERLKYGYEVSWLIYAMQFGLPVLFFFVIYLFSPFFTIFSRGAIKVDRLFAPFCMFLFLMIGFTNPIILGSLAAVLYLFLYLCGENE